MAFTVRKFIICLLTIVFILGETNTIFGQAEGQNPQEILVARAQPPMENVFFNVLWGSLTGGMLMMSWSIVDDSLPSEERYKLSQMSNSFFTGATYGGIMGMAAGVYFSIKGITFDENRSRIAFYPYYDQNPDVQRFFRTSESAKVKDSVNLLNFHFRF